MGVFSIYSLGEEDNIYTSAYYGWVGILLYFPSFSRPANACLGVDSCWETTNHYYCPYVTRFRR